MVCGRADPGSEIRHGWRSSGAMSKKQWFVGATLALAAVLALGWTVRGDILTTQVAAMPVGPDPESAAAAPVGPLAVSPPADLAILPLDSSLHVTWTSSSDPATAWYVVSVWDGD